MIIVGAEMVHSLNKGKEGERELAHFLGGRGFPAHRGQQFRGGTDSPDVVVEGLPDVHFECKRVEAGNPYVWLAQAIRDAGAKLPVVAHKRNGKDWIAVLPLSALLALLKDKQNENS